jgi:hypothetical protein
VEIAWSGKYKSGDMVRCTTTHDVARLQVAEMSTIDD